MPTDFTSVPDDFSTPVNPDAQPFAQVPAWDRGKKRKSFVSRGESVAAEPRSFAAEAPIVTRPTTLSDDARAYEARMDTTDTAFAPEPVFASRTAARNTSSAPIAIMAGIILLGGIGAAGWYYSQPHDAGVAQLTPGAAATTTTTQVASTAPALNATNEQPPAEAAAPPVSHATTTTTTAKATAPAKAPVTRTRTTVRSATDNAADVSTTAPVQAAPPVQVAPQPAPAAPPAAAAPAPLVLTLPAQPAPTQAAPAPTPTPPTETPPTH